MKTFLLVLIILLIVVSGRSSVAGATGRVATYGKLPLQFEANQGQADKAVRFLAHSPGYSVFLKPTEAVFVGSQNRRQGSSAKMPVVMRMQVVGANPAAPLGGAETLGGRVNYLTGADSKHWITNVPTFRRVKSTGIYKGIDLVYYGTHTQMEYDFIVAPGTDPNAIRLSISCSAQTKRNQSKIDKNGVLIFLTAHGQIRWKAPVAYQISQTGHRTLVAVKYFRDSRHQIGFRLGKRDLDKPLVIDPIASYVTYLGETEDEAAYGIAADSAGCAYVTGNAPFAPFPITYGSYQTNPGGVFVSKFNAAGDALIYSTYIGTYGSDSGYAIAVDSHGNAYITGQAHPSFPTTAGAYQAAASLGGAFVAKLDPTGSSLLYSTFLADSSYTAWGSSLAVDTAGDIWVTGAAVNGFPITPGGRSSPGGGSHAFVAKIDPTQSGEASLVYSTYLGGSSVNGDAGLGIAVDSAGNAYVGGQTSSSDFPTTAGAYQTHFGGGRNFGNTQYGPFYEGEGDGFITKFSPTGTILYSTYLGGGGGSVPDDAISAIAVDAHGNAYVTGIASSVTFPITSGTYAPGQGGGGFVTKLNASGSALVYSSYIGNHGGAYGIAVDAAGDVFLTGTVHGSVSTTSDAYQKTFGGGGTTNNEGDAFLEELNPTATHLLYATYLGGSRIDASYGIALDPAGNIYVAGKTFSNDFPVTPGAFQTVFGNGPTVDIYHDFGDVFLAKFSVNVSAWRAVQIAAGAGNKTHILWDNADGRVSVWNYSTLTGAFTQNTYGPYSGWAANSIADGSDGKTRLLWNNINGTASLWSITTTAAYTANSVGPYPGWTAKAIAVAADNTTHILWTNTGGAASIWNYNTANGQFTQLTYGPYSGWSAKAIADGSDGKLRVLWNNTNGQISLWSLDNTTGAFSQFSFGPYAGWSAKAISVSNSMTHILWNNADGRASVWNYSTLTGAFAQNTYGPYSGWATNSIADGSDGKANLLWNNTSGTASLWNLDNATGVFSQFSFGPYF